jgi:hypothetical protein
VCAYICTGASTSACAYFIFTYADVPGASASPSALILFVSVCTCVCRCQWHTDDGSPSSDVVCAIRNGEHVTPTMPVYLICGAASGAAAAAITNPLVCCAVLYVYYTRTSFHVVSPLSLHSLSLSFSPCHCHPSPTLCFFRHVRVNDLSSHYCLCCDSLCASLVIIVVRDVIRMW